jgi:hypothetical protein
MIKVFGILALAVTAFIPLKADDNDAYDTELLAFQKSALFN